MLETFCEESLFRSLYHILHDIRDDSYHFTEVEMWEDAKDFVLRLAKAKYPTINVVQMYESLKKNYQHYNTVKRDDVDQAEKGEDDHTGRKATYITKGVLFCVYAIIYASDTGLLWECLEYIDTQTGEDEMLDVFENKIDADRKAGMIVHDYDYFRDEDPPQMSPEILKINELQQCNDELRVRSVQLQERVAQLENELQKSRKPNMARAISLLKEAFPDAFDLKDDSNNEKENLYDAVAYLFNASHDTCKDYLKSSRRYENDAENYGNALRTLRDRAKRMIKYLR